MRQRHVIPTSDIESRVPQVFNCVDTENLTTNGRIYLIPQIPHIITKFKYWRVYYSPTLFETPARNITNNPAVYCVACVDAYEEDSIHNNPVFQVTYFNNWVYSNTKYTVAPANFYNLTQVVEYIHTLISQMPVAQIPDPAAIHTMYETHADIATVIQIEKER